MNTSISSDCLQPPRIVPIEEFPDYVPSKVLISSEKLPWQGLHLFDHLFPVVLGETPAPGIRDFSIGVNYAGHLQGDCTVSGSKYRKRELHSETLSLYPPFDGMAWHWRPKGVAKHNPRTVALHFSPQHLETAATEALDIDFANVELKLSLGIEDALIRQLVLALKAEVLNGGMYGPLYAEHATQMLCIHLLNNYCTTQYRPIEYHDGLPIIKLQRVIDYIRTYFNQKISLAILADMVGLSAYHFARLFKQTLGESPHQYIIRCRMNRAKELLKHSNLTLLEISSEIGYEGQNHFTVLFKRFTGMTPGVYREGSSSRSKTARFSDQ